ncbi:uncharacterized protein LOC143361997 [Halictus rubicundus]|uniref:uncharacterized protein LOC143361997 n=1 Tax=Halictus rubicundus TaxID=77578 RepID=UPI0040353CB5
MLQSTVVEEGRRKRNGQVGDVSQAQPTYMETSEPLMPEKWIRDECAHACRSAKTQSSPKYVGSGTRSRDWGDGYSWTAGEMTRKREDSDWEPDADNVNISSGSQYVAKSGMKWFSCPFRISKRSHKNYVNAKPGLSLLGTVHKNKRDIPAEISIKSRAEKSLMFAFTQDIAMVSYIPKKGKIVHLPSTQHDDDIVSEADENKPIMIFDYNKTKGAVDNADKLVREYSCARRTKRWPYRLFMNIIDIAAHNSFILYNLKHSDWLKGHQGRRRMFLMQLGQQLAQKNMESRAKIQNMPKYVKDALRDCGVEPEQSTPSNHQQETSLKKRGRCYLCSRKEDKKSCLRKPQKG